MADHVCANPTSWHPRMHTHQDHHHPPQAWRARLDEAPWWRIISLCGLCHDEYHTLLDAHVRALSHALGVPPASVTRTYSRFIRALVAEAWEHRPPGKPPYTAAVVPAP